MRDGGSDSSSSSVSGHRKQWYSIFVFLIIAIVVGGVVLLSGPRWGSQPLEITLATSTPSQSREMELRISGMVANPGIYTVDEDDTLGDVIRIAGGRTADLDYSEIEIDISLSNKNLLAESQKVDVNTAEEWLLCALPGIGPERAGAIINYRDENGPFKHVEEILDVPGIGPATFEDIKNLVTVVG